METALINTEYKSWNDNLEVTGDTILSLLAAMRKVGNEEKAIKYLEKHEIIDPKAGKWYPLKKYLGVLKNIYEHLGDNTLYLIGLNIPNNAIFPPEIKTFEDAMNLLDAAYQANHRGGYIGYFKFTKTSRNTATMECKRTYGTMIDKGVLMGLSRKFRPEFSIGLNIEVDESKPNRKNGADSNVFNLKW